MMLSGTRIDGVFTIYDWHFARNLNDNYSKTKWNIGGKNINDYFAFVEALELFNKSENQNRVGDGVLTHARLHELPEVGATC